MEWLIIIAFAVVAFIALIFASDETNFITIVFSIVFFSIFFFWTYQLIRKPRFAFKKDEELLHCFQDIEVEAS